MLELINEIGWSVFTNVLQIAAGSILAVIIYTLINMKCCHIKSNIPLGILIIAASSILGLMLPMGTYGSVPLVLLLLAMGIRHEFALPLLFSNVMFNLLVSYVDMSFSWKTGMGRIVIAFTAGFIAGVAFMLIKSENADVVRLSNIQINNNPNLFLQFTRIFSENINFLGLFLIIGSILNAIFHRYLLVSVVNAVFLNPVLNNSLKVFLWFDIANPYMQHLFNLFSNFTAMAAFVRVLRLKGLVVFAAVYSVLTLIFSIATFIW